MTASQSQGTLIVPIANSETVDRLIDTAIDIARGQSMSIVAVHVVEVPDQLPLDAGDQLVGDEETELLEYAADRVTNADITVETKLRYSRKIAPAIVGSVDAYDVDALLMGWRGRPRRRDIVLGSFLDRVLGEAPCDVYVKRIKLPQPSPESILVPVAGGPHDELATDLAGTIADQHDATVTLFYVEQPDGEETEDEGQAAFLRERHQRLSDDIEVEELLVESDHVAGAITDETTNHDLTILGATRDPFLGRKLAGSVAQGVGRTAGNSVIITRRYLDEE